MFLRVPRRLYSLERDLGLLFWFQVFDVADVNVVPAAVAVFSVVSLALLLLRSKVAGRSRGKTLLRGVVIFHLVI